MEFSTVTFVRVQPCSLSTGHTSSGLRKHSMQFEAQKSKHAQQPHATIYRSRVVSYMHQGVADDATAKCIPRAAGPTRLPHAAFMRMPERTGATDPKPRTALHAVRSPKSKTCTTTACTTTAKSKTGHKTASQATHPASCARASTLGSLKEPACNPTIFPRTGIDRGSKGPRTGIDLVP